MYMLLLQMSILRHTSDYLNTSHSQDYIRVIVVWCLHWLACPYWSCWLRHGSNPSVGVTWCTWPCLISDCIAEVLITRGWVESATGSYYIISHNDKLTGLNSASNSMINATLCYLLYQKVSIYTGYTDIFFLSQQYHNKESVLQYIHMS